MIKPQGRIARGSLLERDLGGLWYRMRKKERREGRLVGGVVVEGTGHMGGHVFSGVPRVRI